MNMWRDRIAQAKRKQTSSFLTVSRSSFIHEPEGHHNLGKYRPKYSRIQKRIQYRDLSFDGIHVDERKKVLPKIETINDEDMD